MLYLKNGNKVIKYFQEGKKINDDGEMNMLREGLLQYFKNGRKIHIKESLKGSFTRYCGGNVTSECIARGKASPDPRIRKKATFAANARKWKHLEGGNLKHNDSNSDVIDYANIEVNPDIFNPYSNVKLGLSDSYKVLDNK